MTARRDMPGAIYQVPVTLSVLVDARGTTPEELAKDAKLQAAKWCNGARHELGEPVEFTG
jgi:hypothetical protein